LMDQYFFFIIPVLSLRLRASRMWNDSFYSFSTWTVEILDMELSLFN
jgi:hypothetical protein